MLVVSASEEPTTKDTDRQLLEASKSGDMDILKVRINENIQIISKDLLYATFAIAHSNSNVCLNLLILITISFLQRITTPQNVNCQDIDGRHSTPLHFAAGYNRLNVVMFLLHNGADVHAKDKGCVHLLNMCS